MRPSLLGMALVGLAVRTGADPTWPSNIDELEEIMFQLNSFRGRKFADTVSPCTNEASGPGRQNAAEWLRTAFHDMSTANDFFGIGGLDASLQYELSNTENTGPGHKTTLEFMGPFMSPRSTLSDLIAMGVYMSVRSCGGPAVPIRAGRIDATEKGSTGVPQPQNSITTFQQQFDRMGFSPEEMIQVTACGHTLGGVHSEEFPDLVPAGSLDNDVAELDSSPSAFDNKVVTEYLAGKTTNALVVGPSVKLDKHSDFKVYNSDKNVTMENMADPATFSQVCQRVLAKMIDTVPKGVSLTEPITAYDVKPVNLQLTLAKGGSALQFTGFIRVKTTGLENSIKSVTVSYKNREGKAECGSGSCDIASTVQGVSKGFDDTFGFFPIDASIPASTGISSFTVTINHADGTQTTHDNNGKGYPLQDAVLLQAPQSCVLGSSGALTVMAAVHNDQADKGAEATVWYKVPQDSSPVPLLQKETIQLKKGKCAGKYTMFSADYTVKGGLAYEGYLDISTGEMSDSFKKLSDLGGTCREFANPAPCNAEDPGDSTTTTPATVTSGATTSGITTTTGPITTTPADVTTTASTAGPTETLGHRDLVGGYQLVSCWTEGNGTRALKDATFVNETMTLEKCEQFCSKYVYWGTEYGQECYCGNSLAKSSVEAPLTDCNMVCGGDASEYCGAGNRLELYSTTVAQPTTTTMAPTGTLTHKPTVTPYTLVGCWSEGKGTRALGQGATASANMTNEACATYCKDFKYFGTEYGSECYCGSFLDPSSATAPLDDCNMPCAGDQFEYCGASSRLELYMNPDASGGDPEQPPAVGDFVLLGCQSEGNGTRALFGSTTAAADMTNEKCAAYCKDYKYFGTEYGSECYCGNSLAPSSEARPAKECMMLCGGSNVEYCGAGNRLSVYQKKEAEVLRLF